MSNMLLKYFENYVNIPSPLYVAYNIPEYKTL